VETPHETADRSRTRRRPITLHPVCARLQGRLANRKRIDGHGPGLWRRHHHRSIGDASNLIPIISSDSSSHEVAGFIYNGLVKYDKDYTIVGDLAESWEVSEDNLTFTFHLRKDVKWQDGVPLRATT